MKPQHVGLLMVGAALAGGLAVRMSQPPTIPVTASRPALRARVLPAAPIPRPPYALAPAPVTRSAPEKTKPFPPTVTSPAPEFVTPEFVPPEPVAPLPVFVEPVAPAVQIGRAHV